MEIEIKGKKENTDEFSFSDKTVWPAMTRKAFGQDLESILTGSKEVAPFIFEEVEESKMVFKVYRVKPAGVVISVKMPDGTEHEISISEHYIAINGPKYQFKHDLKPLPI